MGFPTALAGASALIGLLGKKKNYNAAQDLNAGRQDLAAYKGVGAQYNTLSSRAMGDYNTDDAAYRAALGAREDHLKADPYTDSRDAADLSEATTGADQQFARADASTAAALARRGVSDGSQAAGAIAANAGRKAGFFAGAAQKLAYQKIAARDANGSALLGLTGGAAGQDYSRGVSALGASGDIDRGAAGSELSLGEHEQSLEDASGSNIAAGLGAAGGVIGQQAGFGGGMGSDPGMRASSMGGSNATLMALLAAQKRKQGGSLVSAPGVGSASFNNYNPGG